MKKLITILIILYSSTCFAQLQCLVKVPVTDKIKSISNLSDKVKEKFKQKRTQATDEVLRNTRIFKDHKLINFVTDMTLAEFQAHISDEKLKWTILAANDGYLKEDDKYILDENGNKIINTLIGYDPVIVIEFIKRKRTYTHELNEFNVLVSTTYTESVPEEIIFGRMAGQLILQPMKD